MKLSYYNNHFYLIDNSDVLFVLSYMYPGKINLIPVNSSAENDIKANSISFKKYEYSFRKNYQDYNFTSKFLSDLFEVKNIQEIFKSDPIIYKLMTEINIPNYLYQTFYTKCRNYYKLFDEDYIRTKNFISRWEMPETIETCIDIFGNYTETEHWLLYKFHNSWGENLDAIIKKASKKFPDFKNIDKAADYTVRNLRWSVRKKFLKNKGLDEYKRKYKKEMIEGRLW